MSMYYVYTYCIYVYTHNMCIHICIIYREREREMCIAYAHTYTYTCYPVAFEQDPVITAITSSRTNIAPLTKGCRECEASM